MKIERFKFEKGGLTEEEIRKEVDKMIIDYKENHSDGGSAFCQYTIVEHDDYYVVHTTIGMNYEILYN